MIKITKMPNDIKAPSYIDIDEVQFAITEDNTILLRNDDDGFVLIEGSTVVCYSELEFCDCQNIRDIEQVLDIGRIIFYSTEPIHSSFCPLTLDVKIDYNNKNLIPC